MQICSIAMIFPLISLLISAFCCNKHPQILNLYYAEHRVILKFSAQTQNHLIILVNPWLLFTLYLCEKYTAE